MPILVHAAVERLMEARSTRQPMAPLSESDSELTLEHAYTIQDALRGAFERTGERVVMSGSISQIVRPKAEDTMRGRFTWLGSVSAKFV